MKDRPNSNPRTWAIVAAIAAALTAGFLVGLMVLGGSGDGERVVRLNHEPAGSEVPVPAEGSISIEDEGRPISNDEVRRIIKAATAVMKGGRVSEIERSDDPGEAFEVEVVGRNTEIDVALDEDLNRVTNQRFSD